MSALRNLKTIARNNKGRLLGTFALVAAENLLLLVYPVFGGFAINGVLAGNLPQALLYAFVVLVIWLVGAALSRHPHLHPHLRRNGRARYRQPACGGRGNPCSPNYAKT